MRISSYQTMLFASSEQPVTVFLMILLTTLKITSEEVDTLIREGEKLAPSLATTRILRAYAGVVRSLQPIMTLQDAVSAVGLYA